jgi:biopolymer transport protein ExbB
MPTNSFLSIVATAAPAGGPDMITSMQVQSVWDFMIKGGIMMIPIGICSFVALAVIVERMISLGRGRIIPAKFVPGLQKVLNDNPGNKQLAMEYCRKDGSPLARVFMAGIKQLGSSIEMVEKHIEDAGEREVTKLRKFLRMLSVIAAITPLMGLLGTIIGMIKAFQTVAMSGEALGKAELLAGGIYEAMITTAAGLCVAIPVLICYHWISSKIDRLVSDMDQMSFDFVEECADQSWVAGMGHATAPAVAPERKTKGKAA